MRGKIVFAGLILAVSAGVTLAQDNPEVTIPPNEVYCSGVISTESIPHSTYVISGQESNIKLTFWEGDYVYINKGSKQGVSVGDEFSVVRPVHDTIQIDWTKWQSGILRKMGTMWADEGRLKVVVAEADTSIAQVAHACDYVQRGDIVLPFTARPLPPLKSEEHFDQFAPPSGKGMAMVITGKAFQQQNGTNDIVYVNLGNLQGVRVGDYFRIFRYTGTQHETVFATDRVAFDTNQTGLPPLGDAGYTGFGSVPKKWNWSNTPREVLGEGVVMRTGPDSSTVLITFARKEIYSGDYVELE